MAIRNIFINFALLITKYRMKEATISNERLTQAAAAGMDEFMQSVADAILEAVGGELNAETMPLLNSDQITLLAYVMMREEVMDGGFVQLIHNGLGRFIFVNPFDKALALWGLTSLSRLVKKAHKFYNKYHKEIEVECTDEEFMAMFERMAEFDDLDDEFVADEEQWTDMISCYIDDNLDRFVTVVD